MKNVIIILLLVSLSVCNASLDLVHDLDASYIIWNSNGGETFLGKFYGDSIADYELYGPHYDATISLARDPLRLLVCCTGEDPFSNPSWLFVVDPATLIPVNSRELRPSDFGIEPYESSAFIRLSFEKHDDDHDSRLIVCNTQSLLTDFVGYPTYLCSGRINVEDSGPLDISDTLFTEVPIYAGNHDFFGPVSSLDLEGLTISSCCSAAPMSHWEGRIASHLPQADPDTLVGMLTHPIYEIYKIGDPVDMGAMVTGSCRDESMVIWYDTLGIVNCSVFTDSVVEDTTYTFPFNAPEIGDPVAMSCNPEDYGILMAWYSGGEIRCRHYYGCWNDFDHIIADGIAPVQNGNIAVYGVDAGYWVAWRDESKALPEIVYVNRSMVMGIEQVEAGTAAIPCLSLSSNPFRQSVIITITNGISIDGLTVYDMSGRIVRELYPSPEGSYHWDGLDSGGVDAPDGVYLVKCRTEAGHLSTLMVKLE